MPGCTHRSDIQKEGQHQSSQTRELPQLQWSLGAVFLSWASKRGSIMNYKVKVTREMCPWAALDSAGNLHSRFQAGEGAKTLRCVKASHKAQNRSGTTESNQHTFTAYVFIFLPSSLKGECVNLASAFPVRDISSSCPVHKCRLLPEVAKQAKHWLHLLCSVIKPDEAHYLHKEFTVEQLVHLS